MGRQRMRRGGAGWVLCWDGEAASGGRGRSDGWAWTGCKASRIRRDGANGAEPGTRIGDGAGADPPRMERRHG